MKDKYQYFIGDDNSKKINALTNISNELALQNELKLIELNHIAVRDNVPETLLALRSFSSVKVNEK